MVPSTQLAPVENWSQGTTLGVPEGLSPVRNCRLEDVCNTRKQNPPTVLNIPVTPPFAARRMERGRVRTPTRYREQFNAPCEPTEPVETITQYEDCKSCVSTAWLLIDIEDVERFHGTTSDCLANPFFQNQTQFGHLPHGPFSHLFDFVFGLGAIHRL